MAFLDSSVRRYHLQRNKNIESLTLGVASLICNRSLKIREIYPQMTTNKVHKPYVGNNEVSHYKSTLHAQHRIYREEAKSR